jgi:hypothetical protein
MSGFFKAFFELRKKKCGPKKLLTFSPTYEKCSTREIAWQIYSLATSAKVSSRSDNEI